MLKLLEARMSTSYDGNIGVEHHTFIRDAQIGWKNIGRDSKKHLIVGVLQYEYLESLGSKLTGEARQELDTFLNKWRWTNMKNPNLEGGKEREATHALRRKSYHSMDDEDDPFIHIRTPTSMFS